MMLHMNNLFFMETMELDIICEVKVQQELDYGGSDIGHLVICAIDVEKHRKKAN